jgi:hypothetical protein
MDPKLAQLYTAFDAATEDRQRLPILQDLVVHHEICERLNVIYRLTMP